jgi:hypothetical protein
MRRRKTRAEKLADSRDLLKVIRCPDIGTLAVPSPLEVDALMRAVPAGRVTTIRELCGRVAKKHRARHGCPLTTDIFAWIAAHAAEEAREADHALVADAQGERANSTRNTPAAWSAGESPSRWRVTSSRRRGGA